MVNILCYGDSNTHGWDPISRTRFDERHRWPMLLQHYLGEGYHVIEEGLGGRTTVFNDPLMPNRCGSQYLYPCLLTHQPLNLIVLMLGTNDLKTTFSPSAAKLRDGMEQIIRIIRNQYNWDDLSPAKILMVSPIHVGDTIRESYLFDYFGNEAVGLSHQLANIYRQLSEQYDCRFLDASLYAKPSPADAIHLDATGHVNLARILADLIGKEQL